MKPTPLTSDMLEVVRELRGVVAVSARLRLCAQLLTGSHPTPIETRITVVRGVLLSLAGELDAAEVRVARPSARRILDQLEAIGALVIRDARRNRHGTWPRNDRLARIYCLAREARRLVSAAS